MVAALRWVQSNIDHFGGTPDNVTIFGESAGSMAVSTLMASPLTQGLFQKAIGESGSGLNDIVAADALEVREQRADSWAAEIGAPTLNGLRDLSPEVLIAAARKRDSPRFGPIVDGRLLTEPVVQAYAEGKQAHVPLLAGWNRDENFALGNGMTADKWKAWAQDHFAERAAGFLRVLPGDTDEQAVRSAVDYGSDSFIAFGTWKWVEAQRKTGNSPVYRYHFEQPAPPSKFHAGSWAFHSDDIEYVFGTLDTRPESAWTPEHRALSELMMNYWTNFAKTGDPNGPGLPVWPKYSDDRQVMHLDTNSTASPSTVEDRYDFLLQGMPPPARP